MREGDRGGSCTSRSSISARSAAGHKDTDHKDKHTVFDVENYTDVRFAAIDEEQSTRFRQQVRADIQQAVAHITGQTQTPGDLVSISKFFTPVVHQAEECEEAGGCGGRGGQGHWTLVVEYNRRLRHERKGADEIEGAYDRTWVSPVAVAEEVSRQMRDATSLLRAGHPISLHSQLYARA